MSASSRHVWQCCLGGEDGSAGTYCICTHYRSHLLLIFFCPSHSPSHRCFNNPLFLSSSLCPLSQDAAVSKYLSLWHRNETVSFMAKFLMNRLLTPLQRMQLYFRWCVVRVCDRLTRAVGRSLDSPAGSSPPSHSRPLTVSTLFPPQFLPELPEVQVDHGRHCHESAGCRGNKQQRTSSRRALMRRMYFVHFFQFHSSVQHNLSRNFIVSVLFN